MDPKNFLDNLLINLGMGYKEQLHYYKNPISKFEKCKLEKTVMFHGKEVPLAKTNKNLEKFRHDLEIAEEQFVDESEEFIYDVTERNGATALYEKMQRFVAETMKYYGEVLEPSLEALQLLGNFIVNLLEKFGDDLADAHEEYSIQLDNINENTYATYQRVEDQISDQENRPVPIRAESKAYTTFSGRTVVDTTYTKDYAAERYQKERAKQYREYNEKLMMKDRKNQFEAAEDHLTSKAKQLISNTVSKFTENFEEIVIRKHSEYFDNQYDKYDDNKYWREEIKTSTVEDIPVLKEILEYYGFKFDVLLGDSVFEHMAKHYGETKTEYKGTDLQMYLKYNNLTSVSPEDTSGLNSAMKRYYSTQFEHKLRLTEEQIREIRKCIYIKESDKEPFIRELSNKITTNRKEDKKLKRRIKTDEISHKLLGLLKIVLIVGGIGFLIYFLYEPIKELLEAMFNL